MKLLLCMQQETTWKIWLLFYWHTKLISIQVYYFILFLAADIYKGLSDFSIAAIHVVKSPSIIEKLIEVILIKNEL